MTRTQAAARLQKFLVRWMQRTVPDLQGLRVTNGRVSVKDSLGWREVGRVEDYLGVARALGVFA